MSRLDDPTMASSWSELLPDLHAASYRYGKQHRIVQQLERARNLIDAQYGDALDLDRLAAEACLSRFHFARLFRNHYHQTPHGYLTQRRLERAKALLLETDQSITQVGLRVGFETSAAFSRAFSQHVGYPPRVHRRRLVQVDWCPPPAIPWCFQVAWHGAAPTAPPEPGHRGNGSERDPAKEQDRKRLCGGVRVRECHDPEQENDHD